MSAIPHRSCGPAIGALLFVFASPLQHVTDQGPTFKSDVELVAINVVVTDKQGRTVTNLHEAAFQVSEDGRPQTITQFSRDPLPLSVVVALDTSASMRGDRFDYARQAIWRLLDRLGPHDEISILGFNNSPYPITSWTSNRNAVVLAMASEEPMKAGGFTALFEAVQVGLNTLAGRTARRRALVVISDGNDEAPDDSWRRLDPTEPLLPRINMSARGRLDKAIRRVTRSEGSLYAIGIAGGGRQMPLDEEALKSLTAPPAGS